MHPFLPLYNTGHRDLLVHDRGCCDEAVRHQDDEEPLQVPLHVAEEEVSGLSFELKCLGEWGGYRSSIGLQVPSLL